MAFAPPALMEVEELGKREISVIPELDLHHEVLLISHRKLVSKNIFRLTHINLALMITAAAKEKKKKKCVS